MSDQIKQLQTLLKNQKNVFSNYLGRTDHTEHDIELTSNQLVRSKVYRNSSRQTETLKAKIKLLLGLEVIEMGGLYIPYDFNENPGMLPIPLC